MRTLRMGASDVASSGLGSETMSHPVRYITVDEITALTGLAPGAVHKRAFDRQWRKLGTRPQRYNLEDVLKDTPPTRPQRVRKHLARKCLTVR